MRKATRWLQPAAACLILHANPVFNWTSSFAMRYLFAAARLFTLLHVAESIPLNLPQRADASSLATLPTAERSQYDIIRSCFITIIACVWTSAHPNIAAPQDAGWKSFKRRLVTMIYALIAPEAIVMWALRQNIASKRIASDYNRTWKFTTQAGILPRYRLLRSYP